MKMLLQLTVCVLALIQLTLSETTFTCVQQEAGEVVDTQQKFSELMALSSQLQDAVSQLQTAVSQLQKDNSRLMAALAVSPAVGRCSLTNSSYVSTLCLRAKIFFC